MSGRTFPPAALAAARGVELEDVAKALCRRRRTGRIADADLRARIAAHRDGSRAFALTVRRVEEEAKPKKGPSPAVSIIKYAGGEGESGPLRTAGRSDGHQGLGWEGEGFTPGEIAAMRGWLRSKGNSIEGGYQRRFRTQHHRQARCSACSITWDPHQASRDAELHGRPDRRTNDVARRREILGAGEISRHRVPQDARQRQCTTASTAPLGARWPRWAGPAFSFRRNSAARGSVI